MRTFRRLFLIASIAAAGQVAPGTAQGAPGDGGYLVEPGDHLLGIARQQGVSLGDLLAANGLTPTTVIHPGQRLEIPDPAASPSAGRGTHTVRPGDTLWGIARLHGVPLRSLVAANGLTLTSVIHPGQQLEVPAGARSSTQASGTPARSAQRSTGSPRVGPEVVERIIRDVWPDDLEETALAIAWRESRYQSDAQSQCCSGLFQIYYDVHKDWLAGMGINSRGDLYHPRTNVEAAFALYQRAGGWGPWSQVVD